MVFYDYEVFFDDWLVVLIDMVKQQKTVIINNPEQMTKFYEDHVSDIWVGCNNIHYDQYILKAILCGFNPKEVNDYIILKGKAGWMFSPLFKKFPSIQYDVLTRIDRGLKTWEGFLGNNIKESSVPFDIKRKLTQEEIEETVKYCTHDVEQTIEVFIQKKADFDAQLGLIKMFPEVLNISDMGRTKAQISAKILECEKVTRDDEFDLFVIPSIEINKYKGVVDWFMSFSGRPSSQSEVIYKESLEMMIAGVSHKIAWGGIHAGKEQYHNDGKGCQMWHVDVASFYPRLMIFHDLLTRNSKKPEKFKQIYDKRLELKHAGMKKEQAPLKIVINGTYGICKSDTSTAYDPRNANLICMNGQLMLIDLIEHLEKIEGFELIQSNTDGLIVCLPDTDEAFEQMDDICFEWESRNNMELEFDEISEIYQKDVNNYVFKFSNGKLERKGAYVKELSSLDYDLPIVNKALVEYMMNGVPVQDTIMQCDDLKEFQMVKKISSKYSCILHGGHWEKTQRINPKTGRLKTFIEFVGDREQVKEKCVRVFASKNMTDGGLWKVKGEDKIEKIEGTPEHCFIFNDEVNGVKCPSKLDKQWYLNTAKDRLKGFGVDL